MAMKAYNLKIKADFDLELPNAMGMDDVEIKTSEFKLPPLRKTKIMRHATTAFYGYENDQYFLHWPDLVTFKINKDTILYQKSELLPAGLLRVFILSEAIGILLFLRGYFLLHASAVVVGSKSDLFLGSPGTGKSTTVAAFAKHGFGVLSDDMVAIKCLSNGGLEVVPAFNEIKIWKETVRNLGFDEKTLLPAWEGKEKLIIKPSLLSSDSKPFLLRDIYLLQRPFSRKDKTFNSINAPLALLKYFPLAHQLLKGEKLQEHFKQSVQIANHSNIKILNRPKNFIELEKFIKNYN